MRQLKHRPRCGPRKSPRKTRGYLPHFDNGAAAQSLTFRLFDALPKAVVAEWKDELAISTDSDPSDPAFAELRKRIERYEDSGYGECWLRQPEIAEIVQDALLHFDEERYRLIAWCVMPNHVHVMIEQICGYGLREILHSWKSFTAKKINKVLGRTGSVWEEDYHDRFIRDETHYWNCVNYIEGNPVAAGLVSSPELWRFSSFRWKDDDVGGAE